MTAIATYTGRQIDFWMPEASQVSLEDLAAGLSRAPRFAGQTQRHYSVAQHSLLVAYLVEPRYRLAALLHDAAEAYLCDVPTPMKRAMRQSAGLRGDALSDYDIVESRLHCATWERFRMTPAMIPVAVRDADHTAMVIEAPRLQPEGWAMDLWDFARQEAQAVERHAIRRFEHLLDLDEGGRYAWFISVADELGKRKQAVPA